MLLEKTQFHFNLVETYIKLFIKPNFISNLDKLSHSCSIKNNKVSVSCDSNVASYALFYGYLSVPIANNFGWYKT